MNFNQHVKDNTLNLRGLTNINIKELISFLGKNSNITGLDLTGSKIGNEGVKALAKYENLKNLTHLDLSGCRIDRWDIEMLARSPVLKNLKELNLSGNEVSLSAMVKLVQLRLGKLYLDYRYKDFYDFLTAKKLNKEHIKEMIFNIADQGGMAVMHVLKQQDKYPFLINSRNKQGLTLSHFYSHHTEMLKFLFGLGMIPIKELERDIVLRIVMQSNQSTHASPAVKKTNFITKNLIESIKTNKDELEQAADSFVDNIPKLLKQYQDNPVMLNLLSITEQEKRSVMEEVLNNKSVPSDKEFIIEITNKAEQALRAQYLRKGQDGKYNQGYSTLSLQYDDEGNDGTTVTIPESIGYVKLLIDRLSIPLEERKELLVTLAAQNPKLVEEKLSQIRSELGNDSISKEQIINKTEFHELLKVVTDSEKIDKLFSEISSLNIEKVWREQKEFVLMKQIYVAKTTYGGKSSACIQGIWSQIINSVSEIDSKLIDRYGKLLDKENGQEKQKDAITEKNIRACSQSF